jgi:hypothetical protein
MEMIIPEFCVGAVNEEEEEEEEEEDTSEEYVDKDVDIKSSYNNNDNYIDIDIKDIKKDWD